MSLVGPRPERPEFQKEIEKEVPEFGLRLQAKAGLTGYAQVYGKYNTTFYSSIFYHRTEVWKHKFKRSRFITRYVRLKR